MISSYERQAIAHAVNKIFDALADAEIGVALQALDRVRKEFQRAQDEPKLGQEHD